MIPVLKEERNVGIESFYTTIEGIGGKLRTIPEDFHVTELCSEPHHNDDGDFSIASITSRNWETNLLVRSIAKQLHISRKRIRFAGTKDKRSVSTQRFSFYKINPEKIQQISLKDVVISDVYRSDKKLFLGDLRGNRFSICIRNVSNEITKTHLSNILAPIIKDGGVPNFFGIQRFGIIRPITHLVGKMMVHQNFKEAVMIYLTFLDEHEDESSYHARKSLLQSYDYKKAFHEFPDHLTYEKAMLNYLQIHPDDFIGALKQLPQNLITMFIYAYQSMLFNRMISQRIKENIAFHQAIEGDTILQVKDGQVTDLSFPVSICNIDQINKQIQRGKAVVCSNLVGFNTIFSTGRMGEIEQSVFEKEGIDKRDFILPKLPQASSSGTKRAIFSPVKNILYQIKKDSINAEKQAVRISFDLQKGSYATTMLREIMKAKDIRSY